MYPRILNLKWAGVGTYGRVHTDEKLIISGGDWKKFLAVSVIGRDSMLAELPNEA